MTTPKKDLVRYKEVRGADARDDQKSAAQILNADALSVTQEDLQEFVLSQIKRIIYGNDAGIWKGDFVGAGISSLADTTRRLINFIDQGPVEGYPSGYKEITGVPWPTAITWYIDATKAKKIVEKLITRNVEQAPTQIIWRLYAEDGVTVRITSTDTIVNTGAPPVFESTRTRVIT